MTFQDMLHQEKITPRRASARRPPATLSASPVIYRLVRLNRMKRKNSVPEMSADACCHPVGRLIVAVKGGAYGIYRKNAIVPFP